MKKAICIGIGMIEAWVALSPAGAAVAEAPSTASPARVSAPWKILGVGLGMTPAEVAAALKQESFEITSRYTGRSWQGEVANRVSNVRSVRTPPGAEVTTRED